MTEQAIRITPGQRLKHGNTAALEIAISKLRTTYLAYTGKLNGNTVVITIKVESRPKGTP